MTITATSGHTSLTRGGMGTVAASRCRGGNFQPAPCPGPTWDTAVSHVGIEQPQEKAHHTGRRPRHLRPALLKRMDITGARWGLQGAEAILKLRALIASGDFDAYWRFHLRREHERIHHTRYRDGLILAA